MLRGETTKRSPLDPERLSAALQAHGVARLRGEPSVWVVLDGSDLRKPHAAAMEHLQRVRRADGTGTVPGYVTLNAIGIAPGKRGLLFHKLFSSAEPGFASESAERRAAVRDLGRALAPLAADGTEVTQILDSGFDDAALWAEVWGQGHRLVCRVHHRTRLVRLAPGGAAVPLADLAPDLAPLARVETELEVRLVGQRHAKRQPVVAAVAAARLVVPYRDDARALEPGPERERPCWLVEVRVEGAALDPWWLLTDRPVEDAAQAAEVFRMYRQRWAIEDAFKLAKTCLGWEEVRVLDYAAVRLLVALGWVATGFLFDLGVGLDWPEVRLLRRLGGGEERANRPPGKLVLMRGLRRVLDHLATEAILADEARRHGVPPRLAALLGRAPPDG
jgi:Transposase DDE domain